MALTGILLGAVALLGVDLALSLKQAGRHHRSVDAVVRMINPADAAILGVAPMAASTALALALLLWLGRRSVDRIVPLAAPLFVAARHDPFAAKLCRARLAVSHRTGGLYGP